MTENGCIDDEAESQALGFGIAAVIAGLVVVVGAVCGCGPSELSPRERERLEFMERRVYVGRADVPVYRKDIPGGALYVALPDRGGVAMVFVPDAGGAK